MNASVECPISVPFPWRLTLPEDGLVVPTLGVPTTASCVTTTTTSGVPVEGAGVFERLTLGQAGLSWRMLSLAKREAFREGFRGFSVCRRRFH